MIKEFRGNLQYPIKTAPYSFALGFQPLFENQIDQRSGWPMI